MLSYTRTVQTIDAHTGGEPLRILVSGLPQVPGATILEKRTWLKENRDDLRQFRQRVAVRLFLSPLAPTDVAQYIRHRWLRAGGTDAPFSSESINCIADASGGIPRVINALCDNALTLAYAEGASLVEARHVTTASTDLVRQEIPRREVPADVPIPEPTRVDGLNHFEHRNGASPIFKRWRKWTGRLGLPPQQESHE